MGCATEPLGIDATDPLGVGSRFAADPDDDDVPTLVRSADPRGVAACLGVFGLSSAFTSSGGLPGGGGGVLSLFHGGTAFAAGTEVAVRLAPVPSTCGAAFAGVTESVLLF